MPYGHNFPPENFSAFRILDSTLTDKFCSIFFYQVQNLRIKVGFQPKLNRGRRN